MLGIILENFYTICKLVNTILYHAFPFLIILLWLKIGCYSHSSVEEEAFEVVALLILLRLWRILRIVNGKHLLVLKLQST